MSCECSRAAAEHVQVLVTHHVALVLPAAHHVLRMLEGRVETQDTAAELRACGALGGTAEGDALD